MADISKITLPNNAEYDLKDATARSGLANKQDTLVSGTNIKTINNESLLGSGNITIQGGGGGDSLPDQTGHAGDYLTTDGTNASWGDAESASTIDIDTTVTANSDHLITSGAVATAISNVDALPSQTGNSGKFLTTDGTDASWATVDALPSQTGNNGKYLTTNGSSASWANAPEEIFVATYNSTTYADVLAAYNAGKTVICKNGSAYALQSYYNSASATFYFRYYSGALQVTTYQVTSSGWSSSNYNVVPTTRTVNSKALSSDITLDASDVGAAASSHTHGNIQNNGTLQTTDVTVANGDKLVVTDADATTANQVARASIAFDGSTTNKYLSPKGTWENVPTVSYPVTSVNTKTGAVVLDNTDVGAAATSHAHGNIQSGGTLQTSDVSVGNGDKLVVTDSSDSNKVARTSVSFDGSTTTKYLSQKGTWESVPTISYPVTSVNTKTGAVVLDNTDVGAAPTSHASTETTYGSGTSSNYGHVKLSDSTSSTSSTTGGTAATPAAVKSAYDLANGKQAAITANGILKGNGSGTISAATAGTDYQAPLPSQTGNSGKFLTTNGSAMSWGEVDALPSQTGNSGKYLTTNGTAASWAATSAASTLTIDSTPTSGSSNVVSSGGIYNAINSKVNRTTAVNAADANYTTLMARGVKLLDATTYDAVSDWSTHLVNGAIAWRYE